MPATLFANKWNMMPPPIIPPPGMEIVVAPVYWPGLKFSISLHISARRHNFYILANYFLGRVLDFPGAAWEGKNHPLKALFSFFFCIVDCCFCLVCAVRKQNWRQLRNAHGLYQSDTSFSRFSPGFSFISWDACAFANPLRGFGEFSALKTGP